MYELMVEDHFDSAHYLQGYNGECKNMHGHRFRVQVFIQGDELNKIGLLVDYKWLKKELRKILSKLDHKIINDVVSFNPTSENLTKYIYQQLKPLINSNATLKKVSIWESEKSQATYYE